MLDEGAGDRDAPRQPQRALGEAAIDVGARIPADLLDLAVLRGQRCRASRGDETDHERGRERPRLVTEIAHVVDDDAVWPVEQTGWSAGAMLLAADALDGLTPAANFFHAMTWLARTPSHSAARDHEEPR